MSRRRRSRRCSRRCPTSASSTARTVVIKYGGAAMRDEELREGFATDVVLLKYVGLNPVIVHGGGPDITSYMERLGMEVRFVEGVRVSDPETVEVAKMVLLGKVNSDIVSRLNRHGQPAVGLSGEDGALFEIRPASGRRARWGSSARSSASTSTSSTTSPRTTSRWSPRPATDREGNSYNVNADTAAGKVAAALRAYKAIFLTDIAGWLADPDDPARSISRAPWTRSRRRSIGSAAACARSSGPASRRSAAGVGSAHIIDGRRPHSLLLELFTDAGIGTMVTP